MTLRTILGVCCLVFATPGMVKAANAPVPPPPSTPPAATAQKQGNNAEWDVVRTLQVEEKPIDTALSQSGRLFVLTEGGKVFAYEQDGSLKGKIELKGKFVSINASPMGDMIFLTNAENKSVQIVSVDFVANINIAGSPTKGPAEAPVALVIFSDFQCPYCSKVGATLEEVLKQFPKEAKMVFKHYPLVSIHKLAEPASVAAMAADKQGKFWEYHNKLFENISNLSDAKFDEIAKELGLDMEKFAKDKTDPQVKAKVQKDMQEGNLIGVRGTPSIFINGRTVKDRSVEGMKKMVEEELKK